MANDNNIQEILKNQERETCAGEVLRNHRHSPTSPAHNYRNRSSAVNYAIRAGLLPRPDTLQCHFCPAQAFQYHHYLGYKIEHRLDVLPVCKRCHREAHFFNDTPFISDCGIYETNIEIEFAIETTWDECVRAIEIRGSIKGTLQTAII